MRTHAIIIGVDGYVFRPLASAVNDAVAVRDALTRPGPAGGPPVVDPEQPPITIRNRKAVVQNVLHEV